MMGHLMVSLWRFRYLKPEEEFSWGWREQSSNAQLQFPEDPFPSWTGEFSQQESISDQYRHKTPPSALGSKLLHFPKSCKLTSWPLSHKDCHSTSWSFQAQHGHKAQQQTQDESLVLPPTSLNWGLFWQQHFQCNTFGWSETAPGLSGDVVWSPSLQIVVTWLDKPLSDSALSKA